ncbi:MAG: hypothetical protein EPO61_03550 [Nitrospirae bacterium]|nr:MAG: hypothetical protein EPO61_03550 [Nitrospirota bacterium]
MLPGLYSVVFSAPSGNAGIGLVVADRGKLHGGDLSYLYRGTYETEGSSVKARIYVSHYRGQPNSILGPLGSFTLILSGNSSDTGFVLSGHVEDRPQLMISITAERRAPLIE